MKFIIFLLSTTLFAEAALAKDKVAYRWVYTIDEETKKFTPTALRLFDHAYSTNIKFLFSCLTQLSDLKYGVLAATASCKKQISNSAGELIITAESFKNSFTGVSTKDREFKIGIVNRSAGFNKLIGCLAGRTKYKNPNQDTQTLSDCVEEIKNGKSPTELTELYQTPTTKSSTQKNVARPSPNFLDQIKKFALTTYETNVINRNFAFTDSRYSREVFAYANCLKFNGIKTSKSFVNDDVVFKYCFEILQLFISTDDKRNAFVFTDIPFRKENYSNRLIFAFKQIQALHSQYYPSKLAEQIELTSRAFEDAQYARELEILEHQISNPTGYGVSPN